MRENIIVTLTCALLLVLASSCQKSQPEVIYVQQCTTCNTTPPCTTCGGQNTSTSTSCWTDGSDATSFWLSDSVTTNLVDSGVLTTALDPCSSPNCGDNGVWTTTNLPAGTYYLYGINSEYEYGGYMTVLSGYCNIFSLSQYTGSCKTGGVKVYIACTKRKNPGILTKDQMLASRAAWMLTHSLTK